MQFVIQKAISVKNLHIDKPCFIRTNKKFMNFFGNNVQLSTLGETDYLKIK